MSILAIMWESKVFLTIDLVTKEYEDKHIINWFIVHHIRTHDYYITF